MRKEHTTIATVGDLRAFIDGVPDDMPIGRLTDGYYKVNKTGDVGAFIGQVAVGLPGEEVEQVILRISA